MMMTLMNVHSGYHLLCKLAAHSRAIIISLYHYRHGTCETLSLQLYKPGTKTLCIHGRFILT